MEPKCRTTVSPPALSALCLRPAAGDRQHRGYPGDHQPMRRSHPHHDLHHVAGAHRMEPGDPRPAGCHGAVRGKHGCATVSPESTIKVCRRPRRRNRRTKPRRRARRIRPEVIGAGAATVASLAIVATIVAAAITGFGSSVERQLPIGVLVSVLAGLALPVAGAWLVGPSRPLVSVGLALTTICLVAPPWASWPLLPTWTRAAALALAPLAVAGTAQVALAWSPAVGRRRALAAAYLLVAVGALVHLLAFNPFAEPGCSTVCIDVDPVAGNLLDPRSALAVTALLTASAALVSAAAVIRVRVPQIPGPVAGAVLAALAALPVPLVVRWVQWGDQQVSDLLLILPAAAATLVGAAVTVCRRPGEAHPRVDDAPRRPPRRVGHRHGRPRRGGRPRPVRCARRGTMGGRHGTAGRRRAAGGPACRRRRTVRTGPEIPLPRRPGPGWGGRGSDAGPASVVDERTAGCREASAGRRGAGLTASASSPPPMPSGCGSSATSTMAPSRGWLAPPSISMWRRVGSPMTRRFWRRQGHRCTTP